MRRALERGANPNSRHESVFRWTPMHLAAINDQDCALQLLQEHGGILNLKDNSGRAPLRLAKKHMRMLAVRCLEKMMGYEEGGGSDTELSEDELDSNGEPAQIPPEEMAQRLEKREKARQSTARRKANYGVKEEVEGPDGMTDSQRVHMDKLCKAARLNAQTGIPMEKILDPDAEFEDTEGEMRAKNTRTHEGVTYEEGAPLPGFEGPEIPPLEDEVDGFGEGQGSH
eukprot:CAMPEP_0172036110 /NCGR_PEP_ID=MMETSP1041-20130122/21978_1 /TAXON_ID=464988 /ORGANISM="Hemiselmis andersenii, Strain CCMP439" /LENGTH=226 /DNA_ID=CAMNT_0012693295 /DNA_START=9 /DNA_END=686 /DNA_ORIENTATION=-